MPGTRRTPIGREGKQPITPRAARLWRDRCALKCTCTSRSGTEMCANCKRAYDIDAEIGNELRLRPWQSPATARKSPDMAGPNSFPLSDPGGTQTRARMAALDEAVALLEAEEEKT
jgi:hypothetical protein